MSDLLLMLVFLPMAAGPFGLWMGLRYPKARDTFVLAVAVLETTIMVSSTIFCREYMAHVARQNRYYLFWLMTLGATMGVFLSADLFTTFIFFEVMSFTSFVAVIQTEEPEALQAGDTYLAVAVIGGLAALTGLFLLYFQLGTLEFEAMGAAAAALEDRSVLWASGILILIGFGAKAGAFPLHIWLPTAHPAAPAPASAVLSGVITKTGIYGVLVLSTTIFLHDTGWGMLLAVIGGITMVLGAVLAVCSIDLKRTFACSSVSQIGFILVGVSMQCLLGHHNALAVDGTILHIFNHSLIKMVLFPAAGVIHLSTHSYDLNEVRGFGRKKPLLAVLMGVPMLSLAGLPLLNGYVSKTLLHESIVEYIHLAPEYGVLFTGLEWLFLFSGGLTLAYMLKVFVCLFGEKNALPEKVLEQKWHGPKPYIAPATAATMGVYLVGMAVLGMAPNWGMDSLAAVARSFLHGEGPEHAVAYFSAVNLRGAAISIVVGSLVYLLVVRRWLIRRGTYIDPIPKWMNLEFGLYRPALRFAAQVAIVAATLVDRILPRLIFHGIPSLFTRGHQGLLSLRDKVVTALTGSEYTPHPSVEQAADDYHFAFYSDDPRRSVGFVHSLAFGLMLTGLGLVFGLLFILLHG